MLLGCIADDFTGASDLANALARQGMETLLFAGVPAGAGPRCEAGVVALKTRSIDPADAVKQSLEALRWLQRHGCEQFFFKYCSTFNSTPKGNIGPVAEALLEALDAPSAVVCPAFPATGRTLFHGHLFVGDRLLSELGMETHPLNPMTDADIRRWLRRQTRGEIGWIPFETVQGGPAALRSALVAEERAGRRLVVVDAVTEDDLRSIGAALGGSLLVTGGSGLALGLPENFRRAGRISETKASFVGLKGPCVALSGSCSNASRAQVAEYLRNHPGFLVDPVALIEGRLCVADGRSFAIEKLDAAPIIHSTADPLDVARAQSLFGRERVSAAIEAFFAGLAAALADDGVTRLVVGGGETSGAVVGALGLARLAVGPEIAPGVPALSARRNGRDLRLALKSGNFGGAEFFEDALRVLEGT